MIWLRRLVVGGLPALFAVLAAIAFPFWVLGIPGDGGASNPMFYRGWFLGYMAIALYAPTYAVWLVVFITTLLLKWPRVITVLHGLIWLCLIAFLLAMAFSLSWIIASA